MTRVCHVSPVHDLVDNRIFYKQCHSLRDAGYDVSFVVQNDQDEMRDGVQIIALPRTKSRWRRWLLTGWQAFFKALKTNADVYHFHDPEFIPQAILLRLLGNKVIYDIHEDYVSSVSQKFYIPTPLRGLISKWLGAVEVLLSRFFQCVIAERYYADRFPRAVTILNYPRLDDQLHACQRSDSQLLYTGKVHLHRGAKIHARLPELVPGTSVSFVGRCAVKLHQELQDENQDHSKQLAFTGVGENVPYQEIVRHYREGNWLAGLAIFAKNEHLEKKELTKFFEYMQHGLPIITSDFPTWKRLVEKNECGICVDPNDKKAITAAVEQLRNDPDLWQRMSENGMRCVREKFSWKSQEETLLKLYDELTS